MGVAESKADKGMREIESRFSMIKQGFAGCKPSDSLAVQRYESALLLKQRGEVRVVLSQRGKSADRSGAAARSSG
jgi:hypothetical protein